MAAIGDFLPILQSLGSMRVKSLTFPAGIVKRSQVILIAAIHIIPERQTQLDGFHVTCHPTTTLHA